MLPLRDLQERIASRLFETGSEPLCDWVRSDGISAAARLKVYRNNLQVGFTRTLGLEFPVIRRLVGEAYFGQLALAFLACHPSRSGDLHHVGAPFAHFLRAQFIETEYLYLADVARLEWACQECLVAEDSECLDPGTLRDIASESYGNLRFTIRSACRLVDSPFPILRIWEANQPDAADRDFIDLSAGGDHVTVLRTPAGLNLCRVPAADFQLLDAFAVGQTLDSALERALEFDSHFDLGAALRRCFELGVFSPMTFY